MNGLQLTITLNNNPPCQAELASTVKHVTWQLANTPAITVTGSGFADGPCELAVIFKGEVIAQDAITVAQHRFKKRFPLAAPLAHPTALEVRVGTEFCRIIPIRLNRLYGRVTDFAGQPIPHPIINAYEGLTAVGDAAGNYEIYLPGKTRQIGVFAKDYSIASLESWLYELDLQEDTRLDIRLDKLEVYEIGGWQGQGGVYLRFIPMSLARIAELMKQGLSEADMLAYPEAWPRLNKADVRISIGSTEVPIASFNGYDDIVGENAADKLTRPGYIIGIAHTDWRPGIVKIELSHLVRFGAEEVLEYGEGYFGGLTDE